LAPTWNRSYSFVDEFLDALAFVSLGRVEVALRIGRDAVHAVELAGLAPAVAEVGELFQRLAQHDADLCIAAVGEKDIGLLRVLRERDVPHRTLAEAALREEGFLDELAVRTEHLQPVVHAVADVQQAIVGEIGAVHRVAELLGRRRVRIVAAEIGVVRPIAVCAPIALHLAGIGVEHGHALVAVAVGDVGFVRFRIDPDLRHPAEIIRIVAAFVPAETADLQQEFSVLGEFQDVGVFCPVAADPDVALVVDENPVVRLRPLVTRAGSAPVPQQIALLVELEHRRRRTAALAGGRVQLRALLHIGKGRRAAMNDPDVVLVVRPHAYGHAEQPMIRQGLRPQRIDFENRRLDRGSRGGGPVFEQGLAGCECGED